MNSKGQSSFEVVLIALFIIVTTLIILSSWIEIQDETCAILLAKTHTLTALQKTDAPYILRKIEVVDSSEINAITMNIYIDPSTFATQEFVLATELSTVLLPQEIVANTKYGIATVNIVT